MQRTPTFEKRSTFETPTFRNWISAKLCKSSTINSDGLRCYNLRHKRRVLRTILIYLVSKLFCYLTKFSFQPSSSRFEIILHHSPLFFPGENSNLWKLSWPLDCDSSSPSLDLEQPRVTTYREVLHVLVHASFFKSRVSTSIISRTCDMPLQSVFDCYSFPETMNFEIAENLLINWRERKNTILNKLARKQRGKCSCRWKHDNAEFFHHLSKIWFKVANACSKTVNKLT